MNHQSNASMELTEAGYLPADWRVLSLGELVLFLDGKRKPIKATDRERIAGDIPYYGASGIVDYVNDYLFDEELILLGEDGENILSRATRLAFRISGKTWVNNHAHVLKTKTGVDIGYLTEYLETIDYAQYNSGTAQPKLNKQTCSRIPIGTPPTEEEQRLIAQALSDADGWIESLERLIAKKRQIKLGTLQALLTPTHRLPGFTGEWETKRLGEIFNFSGGYSASRDQLGTEGVSYLHYGDIHGTTRTFVDVAADHKSIPKLPINSNKVSAASMLADGDVVFVDASEDVDGTNKHVVVVNPNNDPFISGLHTIVAKPKGSDLTSLFCRYCFQTDKIKQQFRFFAVGTKVSGVSKTNIAKIETPVPKLDEQQAIATILSDMDAELSALEAKLTKARQIKAGMMQQLLTGRIRLVASEDVEPVKQANPPAAAPKPGHNQQINEAVILAALVQTFGSEPYPLGRMRRTKLAYLLHRHEEGKAEGFLKKAAGPYNPGTRYGGPENIAIKNGYVREATSGKLKGLVAAEKIDQAMGYFDKWYGLESLKWLEQFRFQSNDDLEVLTTVDMAADELRKAGQAPTLQAVKTVMRNEAEWRAKLDRPCFCDSNIIQAIDESARLFGG